MEDILVELDERRRVSLGKLALPEHHRYLARQDPDGTITLTPAVVMTELEARFLANASLVAQIRDDWEHLERLAPRRKGGPAADSGEGEPEPDKVRVRGTAE